MILTMDVGNTNIKAALFDHKEQKHYWRMSTSLSKTSDEYGIELLDMFRHENCSPKDVEGIIISSVVPSVNYTMEHMCRTYFGRAPMVVGPQLNFGIELRYDTPLTLGSDRIANAVAAQAEYGSPCVFVDFGTATTFGAIDKTGAFVGGTISPGLKLSSNAIVSGTAKLPRFELLRPEKVIGTNTVACLQSGVINGYIGQIMYLVQCFRKELQAPFAPVIATGGMAVIVNEEPGIIDVLDGILTLKGLRIIYERNQ